MSEKDQSSESLIDTLAGKAYHKFIKATETAKGTSYNWFQASDDVVEEELMDSNPRDLLSNLVAGSGLPAAEIFNDHTLDDFYFHPDTYKDLDSFIKELCQVAVRLQLEKRYPQVMQEA